MKTNKDAQTIWLTGCTSGLGRALVDEFTATGHTVAACGRRTELIEKLQQAFPSPHFFSSVDVADDLQAEQFCRDAYEATGARHAVPVMIERGKGIIVNFSSGWGRSTSPEVAPYCASKWAIEGLSQALAQELPRGLAAMALNPGVINTRMLQTCWGEHASSYEDAENWARTAAPFLLGLKTSQNGQPLSAP